jgi:capsular exopolysaccharide synthesis family protein
MTSRDPATAVNHPSLIDVPNGIQAAPRAAFGDGRHEVVREFESLFASLKSQPTADQERLLLIGITGLTRGAGVSTVAINLARAAANVTDGRVALVDANSAHAVAHECLSTPLEPGLNDYLSGTEEFTECIHETSFERLLVVPNGSPDKRTEKVSVVELIDSLGDLFDYAVVDLPPIGALDDRMALARNLDCVLLVVPADRTEVLNVRSAIKQIAKSGIHVRGTVLNAVRKTLIQGSQPPRTNFSN